ncbi:galactokinase [Roseateles violae]|uniref:Galactokinase n=1 Tax=Roseateles violae TaxID=3058042 RepID=A0ABT8DLU5_9BURK|nr:galactokinase [Pelomonas sp. PFR6]MDN3919377.1 galactokinase [Pelomonas sp. PFR6]
MKPMSAAQRASATFAQFFGGEPQMLARAPGRVNLIGEFTDYNEGFCLPAAIERDCVVAIRARRDGIVHVVAADEQHQQDRFTLDTPLAPVKQPQFANYVRGVLAALQAQGLQFGGAELAIAGDVPLGAGLSSSAALELAIGQAFKLLYQLPVTPEQLARAGQSAEHRFAGCMCGLMDQLSIATGRAGHAMLLDMRSLSSRLVPLPAGAALLIVDSRVSRGLADSEYNLRREHCEAAACHFGVPMLRDLDMATLQQRWHELPEVIARRARHIVSENARTLAAADALQAGDLVQMGELMRTSHTSLREDFEVTVPQTDRIAELLNQVLGRSGGARMTGGGFGGCVVALGPLDAVPAMKDALARNYRNAQGEPARIHLTGAADGAGRA